jgi:hypothetical protein
MFANATPNTASFNTKFFPQQILLLSVSENMIPMGYWTVISKEPFRFLVCMQLGNYSLGLIRKYIGSRATLLPLERSRVDFQSREYQRARWSQSRTPWIKSASFRKTTTY